MRARTSPIWKIDKEELEAIVKSKNSICEVLEHFGYNPVGGMHRILKQRCEEDGIDLIDIKRRAIDKRVNGDYGSKSKYSNDELFVADSSIARKTVKRRLIQDGLIPYQCVECGIGGIWRDKSLSLVLDHINGLNNDNRLENLRFLCPNCNSQTETFAGRNSQGNWKKLRQDLGCIKAQKRNCEQCGKEYSPTMRAQRFCSIECSHKNQRKAPRPPKEELQKLIEDNSWREVGRIYGVSDNAIRDWAEKYEIQKSKRDASFCEYCKALIVSARKRQRFCSIECAGLSQRKERPSRDELQSLMKNLSLTAISKQFGVSPAAIGLWAKEYSLKG